MVSVDLAVVVPPARFLESGNEVVVEPINGCELVVIVLSRRLCQVGLEKRDSFNYVANVLLTGREQGLMADVGEVASAGVRCL